MSDTTQIAETKQAELNHSERFTNKVLLEFGSSNAGDIQISEYQRRLIGNYFVAISGSLKSAEEDRIRKNKNNKDKKYNNDLPIIWDNVNLNALALSVVHYARMGLDMMQDNHLSPIPFKNNNTGKYELTLMPGYNGIIYVAEKYALKQPKCVTTELVYSTDNFKPIKKGMNLSYDSYDFEITNPFNRGEIVGGFGYIEFDDIKDNKLIIMTKADFDKRKPKYASANFWGGESKQWEDGKQITVQVDGWEAEMYMKTLKRAVYSPKNIPLDPKKIDDSYQFMKQQELEYAKMEAQSEIDEKANVINIDSSEIVEDTQRVAHYDVVEDHEVIDDDPDIEF